MCVSHVCLVIVIPPAGLGLGFFRVLSFALLCVVVVEEEVLECMSWNAVRHHLHQVVWVVWVRTIRIRVVKWMHRRLHLHIHLHLHLHQRITPLLRPLRKTTLIL